MGRSETTGDVYVDGSSIELPEHAASVSSFSLDKYEVTVGRFRQFVVAYDTWHAVNGNPTAGAGFNPNNSATAWDGSWNAILPTSAVALNANLQCDSDNQTWTETSDRTEAFAINCVNWYEAFAFCVWDGGRLPTEAEWEYAAAGGDYNWLYPWGSSTDPSSTYANYADSDNTPFRAVGIKTAGAGRWGHLNLAGGVWEWVFDYYQAYASDECVDCVATCPACTASDSRTLRGGSWSSAYGDLRATRRTTNEGDPSDRSSGIGFRCVR